MILYYTGTGNSRYVAKHIGQQIQDQVVNLFEPIRKNDYSPMESLTPWVIVVPTYAWQIPHIVRDWMNKTVLAGNQQIYFVMTCGDDIGNGGQWASGLCEKKGMTYMGCQEVIMPENYIALYNAPDTKEAKSIIKKAATSIDQAVRTILEHKPIPPKKVGIKGKINSSLVNSLFYSLISAKKFRYTDACIGCGHCTQVCPLSNIILSKDSRPQWGKECTHCMACICTCPTEAIEYGKTSVGKPRYQCPDSL